MQGIEIKQEREIREIARKILVAISSLASKRTRKARPGGKRNQPLYQLGTLLRKKKYVCAVRVEA